MSDIVEAVARAICVAEGLDPDKTGIGFGYRIPVGVEYALWEAQRKNAEAAIAAVGVETEQLRAENERLHARVAELEGALNDARQNAKTYWRPMTVPDAAGKAAMIARIDAALKKEARP
jgi:hypothetical protein